MLKIIADEYTVQLTENFSLNLIIENPFVTAERIPTPYTTTFDLPSTPENLKFFKFPNRVTSKGGFKEYSCRIYFGAINILTGALVVQQFNKTIKAFFRGVVFSDNLTKKLKDIDAEKYSFGLGTRNVINFNNPDNYAPKYRQFIQSRLVGSTDFVAAPIRIKDAEWPNLGPGQAPWGFGYDALDIQYFNFFNAKDKTYAVPWEWDNRMGPVFPQPFLHTIFDEIFDDTLEENVFHQGELAKIVLVTSYHPNYYDGLMQSYKGIILDNSYQYNIEQYFKLESYLPDLQANEFFKDILKVFCCTLFSVKGKFRIVFNQDILNSRIIENWGNKLIGELIISKVDSLEYIYGYADNIDEMKDYVPVSTVGNLSDLVDLQVTPDDNENEYYVASLNQVMKKIATNNPESGPPVIYTYEVVNAGFGGFNEPEGESFDMVSNVQPLPMTVDFYWWNNVEQPVITRRNWMVPIWEGDRLLRPNTGYIMIYQGLNNTFTQPDQYPMLTNHNVDQYGNRLGDISLNWDGENGLLIRFHTAYREWIETTKLRASGTILLSALDLKNLDLSKKKHIQGKLFFIEKLSVTINHNGISPAEVDFIEATPTTPPVYRSVRTAQFQKQGCGTGVTGSFVPYSKTYTSLISQNDADQQADADTNFNAEGQANANLYGVCLASKTVIVSVSARPGWKVINGQINKDHIYASTTVALSQALSVNTTFYVRATCYVNNGQEFGTDLYPVVVNAGALSGADFSDLFDVGSSASPSFLVSVESVDPVPPADTILIY